MNISAAKIYEHVKKIFEKGPRVDGSPASISTVEYIEHCLSSYGCEIDKIPMEFPYVKNHQSQLVVQGTESLNIPCSVNLRAKLTGNGYIEGEAVFVNTGLEKDYKGVDANGKIVFAAETEYWEGKLMVPAKYYQAVKRGAAAFIFSDKRDDSLITTWGLVPGMTEIPTVSIPYDYYTELKKRNQREHITLQLKVSGEISQSTDFIISGKLDGTDPSSGVIFIDGSHHETVTFCPGANDNASGIAIALELIHFFSTRKNRNTIVFISTCAEECGCQGIEEYLKNNKPLVEKARAAFVIDQVAMGNHIIKKHARRHREGFSLEKEEYDESTKWLVDLVVSSANKLGYFLPIDSLSIEGSLGEVNNFLNHGTPAIFLCGWNTDLAYHTPKDDLRMINANALKAIADTVAESIIILDNKEESK